MVENPFSQWLAEVAGDAVVVQPDNIEAEARGNQWSFSLAPDQAAAVSPADVATFAAGVEDGKRAWLSACGAGPMVLYWWHDAQAGQLRFSLVSASHSRLPFGCAVVPAVSIAAVAAEWLGSPLLHGIPWDELRPLGLGEEPPEPPLLVLSVWSQLVP